MPVKKKTTSGNYAQEFRQISAHVQAWLTKPVVLLSSKQVTLSFPSPANEDIKQVLLLQQDEVQGFRNDFLFFFKKNRPLAPKHLCLCLWPALAIALCIKKPKNSLSGT